MFVGQLLSITNGGSTWQVIVHGDGCSTLSSNGINGLKQWWVEASMFGWLHWHWFQFDLSYMSSHLGLCWKVCFCLISSLCCWLGKSEAFRCIDHTIKVVVCIHDWSWTWGSCLIFYRWLGVDAKHWSCIQLLLVPLYSVFRWLQDPVLVPLSSDR